MNINLPKISFKGYDAAPLKSLYIEEFHSTPIEKEMEAIGKKENIDIRYYLSNNMWAQDDKTIVERDGKPFVVANSEIPKDILKSLKYDYKLNGDWDYGYLTGGNTFIGKYPNGEKWLITGEYIDDTFKNYISECYQIPKKNIHEIPIPDFHIDMGIRPIGYPDVLVNDPKIAEENLKKLDDGSRGYKDFKKMFDRKRQFYETTYASADEICDSLKKLGFNPIRVGGVYYNGINFMNAIVNKHQDGTMSYITNASACRARLYTQIQKIFEEELREKAPNIKTTYFVKGTNAGSSLPYKKSYMIDSIENKCGGIHCMTMEEPDFERWA